MAFNTIAIVGLGLMGGSLALALRETWAGVTICGIDRDPAALDAALGAGAVDRASTDLHMAGEAELVVLATPVRAILEQLPRLGEIARDGALLLDLGSTKRQVVAGMNALPTRLLAVGGHPMCGKEIAGFGASEASLFRGCAFVLTPTGRSSAPAMELAGEVARATGALPMIMTPERHDEIVAAISHLPFLVAANLAVVVGEWAGGDERVGQLASSGFRDTSRLAASETAMMMDILQTNRENICTFARRYALAWADLADLFQEGKEDALRATLVRAAEARQELVTSSHLSV